MILYFALFIIVAYLLQIMFSLYQMKNFNLVYTKLKHKGKVAIGKKSGKIRSGTIVMLSVNEEEKIVDAYQMQGVTVFAKFKPLEDIFNVSLSELSEEHPGIINKNKLTKETVLQAKNLYYHVKNGTCEEENQDTLTMHMKNSMSLIGLEVKTRVQKLRRKSE